MAGVFSVPANKGKSVENECSDPKTNAMTIQSIKSIYSWKSFAGYHVPCITRVINDEELKFVSVRMAETQLLSNYLHNLHADIYTYASVRSYFITDSEAKLLNEINIEHSNGIYGKDTFYAGKDYIVRLEDVIEFYIFIKVCYNKVLCNNTPGRLEKKCGFIFINAEYAVPYCLKDGRKYLPLFYFEGETEGEWQHAVILQDWNLAYIKFCCKVQGIDNELYNFDSCTATTLDVIKNCFPPETSYEEYWPVKAIKLQINQKSTHVHPSGIWIKAPPEVPVPESTIPHSLTASAPVIRQCMPVVMNTIQNVWPPNQLVNSYTTPALPPQTTCGYSIASRNQSIAAQCYNAGPQMSQGNSLMNGESHVISPPPLDRANNTAPAINQCMTTMYNPVPSSSVMSQSNQTQQFYNQRPSNNSQAQQQQVQQHQQQLQQQQPQQEQKIKVQPYSCPTSVHGRLTNTEQRNAIRNVAPVVITPATEIIGLSSPPSSPTTTLEQYYSLFNPYAKCKSKKISERTWEQDSTNNAAYQGPQMSQGNSLMNGESHVISPPPLDRANNTAPAISQCMTTVYNPVPSSSVMSQSNQTQQFYNQRPSNNSQAQQQQVQQHQQQLQQQQQPQQEQKIKVQPYSCPTSVHGRLTNTEQRNAIRNVAPVVITPATEIISLSSPPSSPTTTLEQYYSLFNPYAKCKSKKIPEQQVQQQVQQHQQQLKQRQQKPRQQKLQQIKTTPLIQLYNSSTSVLHSSLSNTQQRNAITNVAPVVITPATEIIDLSSPPSSPTTTLEQYSPSNPNAKWILKIIPERTWEQDSTNNAPYQVLKAKIDRKLINCINVKPYIHTDFMVALLDVILDHLLQYDIFRCAYVLYNNLNITLFCGNSEQMNELRENTSVEDKKLYVYGTPMVRLRDITFALPKLKELLSKQDEQQRSTARLSKRLRTS